MALPRSQGVKLKNHFQQKLYDDKVKSSLLSDLVLLLARDQSCSPYSKDDRGLEFVFKYTICMKFDIYFLRETDGILKWEEMGTFGNPNNDGGTMYFPKIIRARKNDIFPFGPEIYLGYYTFDYQSGNHLGFGSDHQMLFENWAKNMSREIDENFPITVTNGMMRLRILQI